ncbi:uncharacterized protein PITG_03808 [Phytophthora infestans T30-4]|uniref:Uncharacterized protein n=1 Tax=Phytophthora infestans (strain T30-4) TaxID=403677 RepID=D0MYK4_PHYIT|nr:uncharacterized protein PITG_03808 [Phytophthora infestans T30-4]EEY66252.1 hypothetical protein PITG_03808 [Phytophthora infestans T30-4]|eukprot:XP_002906851.1 hypothetical protein PITG_03808 [Phytophthora infestans T30-4]
MADADKARRDAVDAVRGVANESASKGADLNQLPQILEEDAEYFLAISPPFGLFLRSAAGKPITHHSASALRQSAAVHSLPSFRRVQTCSVMFMSSKSDQLERVYDSQDRRIKAPCGSRIFYEMVYCVNLMYALCVRDNPDIFGRAGFVYRGRNKARCKRRDRQGARHPVRNGEALQLD